MWAAYYHYHTTNDTLMIIMDPWAYPTRVIKTNEVISLYKDERLIGINILNFSNTIKMKTNGRIIYLPPVVLKVINDKLENAGLFPLIEENESGFIVARVMSINGNEVTLNIGKDDIIIKTNCNVNLDTKVVIAKENTILFNLDIVKKEEKFRILNGYELGIEQDDIISVDSLLNEGDDYFINIK